MRISDWSSDVCSSDLFDTQTGKSEVFAEPKLTFKPADFTVEQRFYKSKDGTEVPMFVVMKKGLDRAKGSPTLLYGYGGFNVSMTPAFSPTRLAWVDKGGILAIANLRGGGEYGKAWHDAGRPDKKQRSAEHTSELQSLMRTSYAVFCLKTKNTIITN